MDLFQPQLCLERWTREYGLKSHAALTDDWVNEANAHQLVKTVAVVKKNVGPNETEKFKKTIAMCKTISEKMSTFPTDIFNHFTIQLKGISKDIDKIRKDNQHEELEPIPSSSTQATTAINNHQYHCSQSNTDGT